MKTLERSKYTKYVTRPVFCERENKMTSHSIFFVKVTPDRKHVLYFKYCNDCIEQAHDLQKNYFEQVLEVDFLEDDFKFDTVIEEMYVNDWKHLWMGDYYDHYEWELIAQRK